ncbi:2-dehydro-3-deoxygalactonokinase [Marinibacterium profundimaris]|uniref:2-keto-3-deoxy-galactonokinase n=1 Tax=Marinibacterium profundimaris TaxID=1679460 RepID=A0A225NF80_9RHOB|nr:2-dehydro-3-deoxygalactonokinase [Marinibacterium profundimaris]OWU70011.1 2-keto-3-deoxy-galactonokinase [Marinibacterium profundimaris]
MTDWIAVDWGTSRLRAWAMGADGSVLQAAQSDMGMGALTPAGFETALLEVAGEWIEGPTRVVACGMVGAKQGWVDAGYAVAPCKPPMGAHAVEAPVKDDRLKVFILPGVSQQRPADVMRGEETQVAGFLAQQPGFDGVICLPGTHTKWVQISAGEIVSFRSFMTGELFALLSGQSVLRHGLDGDGWDEEAFDAGVADGLQRPQFLTSDLFGIRAEGLLNDMAPAAARARLSGLLIGAELAGSKSYWLGQQLAFIGAPELAGAYQRALKAQAAIGDRTDAEAMTLAGLCAANDALG